ncbi:hypothetical protein HYPSUDRAFT_56928 [Hypholoma sublateritium FD-334 SS-4]|uniref:Uncharacterized protein n=1 Tax=Hypholoma sublateritium (strain FD-334 SS-4) TaxID=945553 RepID=A0A0D2NQ22_HYPSF|nr:hypothetical protein HYPSUDRAFT_56928 [Hypholoma sublateritium FD-334 SS-4]
MAYASDLFHPYMSSEGGPSPQTGPVSQVAQDLIGLQWGSDGADNVVALTPGPQQDVALPLLHPALPTSRNMESIFNEPAGGRNLFEIHHDRWYKQDITHKWIGTERVTVYRPKFKKSLSSPGVDRFWNLSTLVLDFGLEHISAAYSTGEFWRSTEKEAVRILVETAKFPPFCRFWGEYSTNDFMAFMAGTVSVHPGSAQRWDFTKDGVKDHIVASYFARQIAHFLQFAQERVYRVAHITAIKGVATLEMCGHQPQNMDDPLTTLAGSSSLFAATVLDTLQLSSSEQSIHQCRIPLHKSASSLSVTRSLLNELGQYPLAHGLKRASKLPKLPRPPQPPHIPLAVFAFGSAMVESRLKVLKDLPITNYEVFGAEDNETKIPMETIDLWSSHKDSIATPEGGLNDSQASPSTNAQSKLASAKVALAADARGEMEKLLAEFLREVRLPIVDKKAWEMAISKMMPQPNSP